MSFLVAMRANRSDGAGDALLPGIVISVVPEAVIVVGALLLGQGVDRAVIAAVALCSLPEAMGATRHSAPPACSGGNR